MRVEDVVDRERLEAYLGFLEADQGLEVARYIAYRSALRVLPFAKTQYERDRISNADQMTVWGHFFCLFAVSTKPYFEEFTFDLTISHSSDDASAEAAYDVLKVWFFRKKNPRDIAIAISAIEHAASFPSAEPMFQRLFWTSLRNDLTRVSQFGVSINPHLWLGVKEPDQFSAAWSDMKYRLSTSQSFDWSFFINWYERMLTAREIHPEKIARVLQRITTDDWQKGSAHINAMFDEVLALYRAEDDAAKSSQELTISKGKPDDIARTKSAMIQHRKELPPTFNSILGYISLEIERLQRQNDNRDEVDRQINVLWTIYKAIEQLKVLVPFDERMADTEAEEAEGILRLVVKRTKSYHKIEREDGRTNLEAIVDKNIEGAVGVAGRTAKAGIYGGIGYGLLLVCGPAVAGGILGLAFGKDAMTAGKAIFGGEEAK